MISINSNHFLIQLGHNNTMVSVLSTFIAITTRNGLISVLDFGWKNV